MVISGYIAISASIIEPIIAVSIIYVGVENILSAKMRPWRPIMVFGFGLLHGMGFASVLVEFGLPETGFIPALVGFNIGVELGQLLVIGLAFVVFGYWIRHWKSYRQAIAIPASAAIAMFGAYLVVERTIL